MPETFTVTNPTKSAQRLDLRGPQPEIHVIEPGASLTLPLKFFRAVFHVRCDVASCRERGFCVAAHQGAIEGGLAPALTYTKGS
jgi:hypothetical protein